MIASNGIGTFSHYNLSGKVHSTIPDTALDCTKGGGRNDNPYTEVMQAGAHALLSGKGLLDYLASKNPEVSLEQILDLYTHESHFVDFKEAFVEAFEKSKETWSNNKNTAHLAQMSFGDYLQYCADQNVILGPYRHDGKQEKDIVHQSKAIAASYFRHTDIPTTMEEVSFSVDGFKQIYWGMIAATMMDQDEQTGKLHPSGGEMLTPGNAYSTLRRAISLAGGHITPIGHNYADAVKDILETNRGNLRIIYLSSVNNPLGDIFSLEDLQKIARSVLKYNKEHPDNPVYVLSDETYQHTILNQDNKSYSIASIDGRMLGDPDLGSMHDWTVTATSTSKTFNGAQQRFGMYTTGNGKLRNKINSLIEAVGSGEIPPPTEIMGVANFALTSQEHVKENNRYYAEQLTYASQCIEEINRKYETPIVECHSPGGAWFCVLKFKKDRLPKELQNSDVLMTVLGYGTDKQGQDGIKAMPGSIYGLEGTSLPLDDVRGKYQNSDQDSIYLRTSLAVDRDHLSIMFDRLEKLTDFISQLTDSDVKDNYIHRIDALKAITNGGITR